MRLYNLERMVNPEGPRTEIITIRCVPESKMCVQAFAAERRLTLADAVRYLLAKGLESEGW